MNMRLLLLFLMAFTREVESLSDVKATLIMQPRRLRCKIVTADFLTREQNISVPYKLPVFLSLYSYCGGVAVGVTESLLGSVQFFDERHAIDFVQGRNPTKHLLQGRLSQTR